ncbi:MAG TPA: alpha/beta hydrolase [Candidatus Thermoplasmatota archaeon]|nr:alpha/beta hydrolase [Candidatus Thermoplasmatota archaeon]
MPQVTSKDGTTIAYEVQGTGPPLVFVWGAMGLMESPFAKPMYAELAKDFTVYAYDRRGRGKSGDTKPFAMEREIEDLAAMVQAAGGEPYVVAVSSGAALALEAAAAHVPMKMLAAHEPPYMVGEHMATFDKDYERNVTKLVADGKRSEAVSYFMRIVGVPKPAIWVMRLMPFWKQMVAVAHTLPYDAAAMNGFTPPEERLREIRVPTVVLVGTATAASLKAAAPEVARLVPGATLRELPKQNHGVKPAALRAALVEVFR